jgi:hypothetical protein
LAHKIQRNFAGTPTIAVECLANLLSNHVSSKPVGASHKNQFSNLTDQKIIELAKAGERDPGRLCDATLEALGGKSGSHRPQSSSASRFTAGAAGFLNLSQSDERSDRQREHSVIIAPP